MKYRVIAFVLLFGIILNSVLILIFRLKMDRAYRARFDTFSTEVKSSISDFTVAAMASIDSYFASNYLGRASSSDSHPSNSVYSSPSPSDTSPFHIPSGSWEFVYYEYGNTPFARVGRRDYCAGDIFPRGGLITSIHPDGIVVDGRYWFSNRPNDSFVSDKLPQIQKESEAPNV